MKKTARFNFTSLFRLIKSLTMSERIYFKKFAVLNVPKEAHKYVKLFDVMEGLKTFDRQLIAESLGKSKNGITINQVGFNLNYHLMGALRAYHSSISIGAGLKDSIRDMELLYIKGHYLQCEKLLERAMKKASRYERLDSLIELLEWERKLVSKDIGIEHQEKFMLKIFDELGEVLEKKLNRYQLELCFNVKYSMIKRYNMIRSEADLERWKQLTDTSVVLEKITPLTFTGEIYYYFIKSMDYFVRGQMDSVIKLVQNRLDALNKRPDLIKDSPHQYITVLGNILSCRSSLGIIHRTILDVNKKEFFKVLHMLREFGSSTIELETRVFANSCIHEIGFCINTGDFMKASALSEKGKKQMKNLASKIGKGAELAFFYYSAYAHFGAQKYEQARESLNFILTNNYGETRIDLQCFARIFNLMIRYEMGLIKSLERAAADAEDFFIKKDKIYQIERIIINLFRELAVARTGDENTNTQRVFKKFKRKLSVAAREKYADNFDEFHHFMWWIESKTGVKSLAELASTVTLKK